MATVLLSLLTLVAGALISGVATYFGTRSKLRLDYDADLRTRRIEAYGDLWRRLEPLAKYAKKASFSKEDARLLAESLRTWYFEQGGLFLTAAARADYFALQKLLTHLLGGWGWGPSGQENLLTHLLGGWGWGPSGQENLLPATREHLRTYGSRLRTSLTRDVGTRSRPKFRGETEPVDRLVAGRYERDDGQRLELAFAPWLFGGTRRLSITAIEQGGRRPVEVREWTPARLTIRAVLTDPDGHRRERVLVIEGEKLVEGPPLDQEAPARAALWRRVNGDMGQPAHAG
jgi:hypothetical protein